MVFLFLLGGCATREDLQLVQTSLDQKIAEVGGKVPLLEKRIGALEDKVNTLDSALSLLKAEDNTLRKDIGKNREEITSLRKGLADVGADIIDVRGSLQELRGQAEVLKRDVSTVNTRLTKKDEELKEIRDRLNSVIFKINYLENFLGIGKDQAETGEKEKPKEILKGKVTDKEAAYAAAYELFKEGKFDQAREAFQNFLKQYPNTEYSDNAQFWIGECYYFEKKYENAILEYEKVIKNYPEGDKVPYALLKQGIAFLNLGDKASAKVILQRLINDYPNTNQAKTAKAKLLSIK